MMRLDKVIKTWKICCVDQVWSVLNLDAC